MSLPRRHRGDSGSAGEAPAAPPWGPRPPSLCPGRAAAGRGCGARGVPGTDTERFTADLGEPKRPPRKLLPRLKHRQGFSCRQ